MSGPPQRTTRSIVAAWTGRIPSVPPVSSGYVCEYCLGAVTGHHQCFPCHRLFHKGGVPAHLRGRTVPMTAAVSPSPWYSVLATYKGAQPENAALVASVAHHFLASRANRIEAALGGSIDIITVVPSKRGYSFHDQSLRKALALVQPIRDRLTQTLTHVSTETVPRRAYNPRAFTPIVPAIRGRRIVLVEDAWVTGATALSAAGALVDAGAASVLVTPVARVIDSAFWPEDHPYRVAMTRNWDPDSDADWPRP